jgi:hypothetical protein
MRESAGQFHQGRDRVDFSLFLERLIGAFFTMKIMCGAFQRYWPANATSGSSPSLQ